VKSKLRGRHPSGHKVTGQSTSSFKISCMEEMFAEYGTYWFEGNNERDKLSILEIIFLYVYFIDLRNIV